MIKFAVFTDLHYEHIHDGDRRIVEFIEKIKNKDVDFIISLGDICSPSANNRKIIDKLNSLNKKIYFTIGNHDSDIFNQEEIVKFYDMENEYYSFIYEETKFIVLNACYIKSGDNYKQYHKKNYNKTVDIYPYIPEKEQKWLIDEMNDININYVIFSHQSLANNCMQRGIANREDVRKILEKRNVILCMNGHDHGCDCKIINGIPYYTLTSMSYIWHGKKEVFSYSEEIHNKYPYLKDMILYDEPFYAIVEIDYDKVKINGMQGNFQTITPEEVGLANDWNGVSVAPKVLDFETYDNIDN